MKESLRHQSFQPQNPSFFLKKISFQIEKDKKFVQVFLEKIFSYVDIYDVYIVFILKILWLIYYGLINMFLILWVKLICSINYSTEKLFCLALAVQYLLKKKMATKHSRHCSWNCFDFWVANFQNGKQKFVESCRP